MSGDDVLKGLTRRQLEELAAKIALELQTCAICETEGALPYRISRKGTVASLLLCKPCFEKHRLPEGRAED
jgi:hypothetical protein